MEATVSGIKYLVRLPYTRTSKMNRRKEKHTTLCAADRPTVSSIRAGVEEASEDGREQKEREEEGSHLRGVLQCRVKMRPLSGESEGVKKTPPRS